MARARKTWNEKLLGRLTPEVEVIERPFAGVPAGSRLLIPTPMLVKEYIEAIPRGEERTIPQMRAELATRHGADASCPMTSSIFVRIVAEAAWEDHLGGRPVESLAPFWRIVQPKSDLAKKLACGTDFVEARRRGEGI